MGLTDLWTLKSILNKHEADLFEAMTLKNSGETRYWEYSDYCLPIDEYINTKIGCIAHVTSIIEDLEREQNA